MIFLKIIGSLFTVFAFAQFGIYKSSAAKKRLKVLQKVCLGLENLSVEIRLKKGELHPLIVRNFCNNDIAFSNNRFDIPDKLMRKNLLDKLNEMVEMLGKSDSKGECEKIDIYRSLFESYLAEADKEYKTNSKLWNTLCISGGITLVLLLI